MSERSGSTPSPRKLCCAAGPRPCGFGHTLIYSTIGTMYLILCRPLLLHLHTNHCSRCSAVSSGGCCPLPESGASCQVPLGEPQSSLGPVPTVHGQSGGLGPFSGSAPEPVVPSTTWNKRSSYELSTAECNYHGSQLRIKYIIHTTVIKRPSHVPF